MTEGPKGVGLGLRSEFAIRLLALVQQGGVDLDFLEVAPENYLRVGGPSARALRRLREHMPVLTHGLTLSIGGFDPLDRGYMAEIRDLVHELNSPFHSDHLCVASVDGRSMHDLMPVPYKAAGIRRIADRICAARDAVGVPLAIENVSHYWHPGRPEMGEAEFLSAVCEAADCKLLLDVNNAYTNSQNFGFDVDEWLRAAPLDRVAQVHVAGHEWFLGSSEGLGEKVEPGAPGAVAVDTHGAEAPGPVLALLERVLAKTGPVPVLIERDQNFPPLDVLLAEVARIRAIVLRAREAVV